MFSNNTKFLPSVTAVGLFFTLNKCDQVVECHKNDFCKDKVPQNLSVDLN